MILSIIASVAENKVIGDHGSLPWRMKDDLARFKTLTTGHPVLMGRKTYESLGGRTLVGREVVILSMQKGYETPGCRVACNLARALEPYLETGTEVFVAGGGALYRQTLPLADRIYLTEVHATASGDAFFPPLPPGTFEEVSREVGIGEPPHSFVDLVRVSTPSDASIRPVRNPTPTSRNGPIP